MRDGHRCSEHWVYHGPEERKADVSKCGCIRFASFTAWNECAVCGATNNGTHYHSYTEACSPDHD